MVRSSCGGIAGNEKMSTYEEICKQRCELCAARQPFANAIRRMRSRPIHTQPVGEYVSFLCTAPTPEQVIEEQSAEIARLKELIAGMEHGQNCQSHQFVCSVCKVPVMDHPPFIEVIDEVLVQHAICPDFEWTPLPCDCLKSKAVKA